MALLCLSCLPWLRRFSYELFLRAHQSLAVFSVYSLWRHVPHERTFAIYCFYSLCGIFGLTAAMDVIQCAYRNFSLHNGLPLANISALGGITRIEMKIPRYLEVRAGQYINIWIPRIGIRSLFQSHPLIIAYWTKPDTGCMSLHLLVHPHHDFSQKLQQLESMLQTRRRLILFGGPYGVAPSLRSFGSVLLISTGSGIGAVLPYIKDLLGGYNECKTVTRRLHLVWQMVNEGTKLPLAGKKESSLKYYRRGAGRQGAPGPCTGIGQSRGRICKLNS